MSYSEDAVISKLSGVNETQDTIVNISQWVMFHRRHASETVKTWAKFLGEAPASRKLALIYLANEVAQQSKARKKEEFLSAFAANINDALDDAYRQVNADTQNRIRRVIAVWRQREIFPESVLDDLDARLNEADRKKPKALAGGRRIGQGMTSFGLGLAPEISKLATTHHTVSTMATSAGTSICEFQEHYTKAIDASNSDRVSESVSALDEALSSARAAHKSTSNVISAREDFIKQMESFLAINIASLNAERVNLTEIERQEADLLEKREKITGTRVASSSVEIGAEEDEGYSPEPEYQPMSPARGLDNSASSGGSAIATMEDLDPKIADFLSSFVGSRS